MAGLFTLGAWSEKVQMFALTPCGRRPNVHRIGVGADALIAELAARQRGRVRRAQLIAAGLSVDAIKHRRACGRLIAEHGGGYAVGCRTGDRLGRFQSGLLTIGAGG